MEDRIGKIQEVRFGIGGYNDAQMGLTVTLGSAKGSWGVMSFKGFWSDRSPGAQWSESDQDVRFAEVVRYIRDLLRAAKVESLDQLVGKPVLVTFDGTDLKAWRILEEAI